MTAIMAGHDMPGVADAGPFRGCPDGSRFRSADSGSGSRDEEEQQLALKARVADRQRTP